LYTSVNKKTDTSTNTIIPAVTTLNIADIRIPMIVLIVLKRIVAIRVFLKERLSFRAHMPGITKRATTSMVPITFIDKTMVMAVRRSKIIVKRFVGMPFIFESSSSKIMARSSLR